MEKSEAQKVIVISIMVILCVAVFFLGEALERADRFGNVFLVVFGAFLVFPFICKTNMYMTGLTPEPGNPKHLFARVVGFACGVLLMVWGASRAINHTRRRIRQSASQAAVGLMVNRHSRLSIEPGRG